jgi:chemotaxis protein methyltransferase CheR
MLTDEEFRLFRNLIYEESGMYFKESRKDFLESRLMKRMQATKTATPYWYYRLVTESRKAELLAFLDHLTINETSFFRNPPQIELFENVILPGVAARKKEEKRKQLRIWSAGCSTGEEPYSIAMALRERIPDLETWNIAIFASDLSLTALDAAHRGLYGAAKVRETVPPALLGKYFEPEGDAYRVAERVRRMVVFDFHNLKHENGLSGLDIIFCRNVMIYFDDLEQKRLVNKLYQSLDPGGYLLLGHAETLHGWNLNFQFIYDRKGTAYRKPDKEQP